MNALPPWQGSIMVDLRASLRRYLCQVAQLGLGDLIFPPGALRTTLHTMHDPHPAQRAPVARHTPSPATPPVSVPSLPRTAPSANVSAPAVRRGPPVPRPLQQLRQMGDWERGDTALDFEGKRRALKELFLEVRGCRRCGLARQRTNTVFGAGNVDAPLVVIGEAPGAEEDAQGLPFVGRAGALLDDMLKAIGLDRKKDVFITNVLKCRPPDNRSPESSEILACNPVLRKQIEILRPRALLLLGRSAAHTVLENPGSIASLRTGHHTCAGIPAVVTYHPAALLRNPAYKRPAWEDLQKLRGILDERTHNGRAVS